MSTEMLEQKLAELQQRMAKRNWRDAIGFAKAMDLGAQWRQKANAEGRM